MENMCLACKWFVTASVNCITCRNFDEFEIITEEKEFKEARKLNEILKNSKK
nr:MAG TPA: hypothetical protein [Caudoviricetes sp.]